MYGMVWYGMKQNFSPMQIGRADPYIDNLVLTDALRIGESRESENLGARDGRCLGCLGVVRVGNWEE